MILSKNAIVKSNKSKHFFVWACCAFIIFVIFGLIIDPARYINSCFTGLFTWATCVLPALFPFFFLTKILTELRVLDKVFNKFSKITKFLFKAPAISAYIFLVSIISGYPVGAKLIEEFYSKNLLSAKQATKLTAFCSTSGPLFIIGTVGTIMFGDSKIGYLMFFSHILSALLNGILFRNRFVEGEKTFSDDNISPDYNRLLSDSMVNSITGILVVGGYIAIFFMLIDMFAAFNILYQLEQLLKLFSLPFGLSEMSSHALTEGIVEVTRGCLSLSKLGLSKTALTVCGSGLITFGGFSIHMQALTFLTKCKINVSFYFFQKITQTVIACLIAFVFCLIFF